MIHTNSYLIDKERIELLRGGYSGYSCKPRHDPSSSETTMTAAGIQHMDDALVSAAELPRSTGQ